MLRDDKKARQRLLAPKFFTEDGLGAEAVVSRSTGRGGLSWAAQPGVVFGACWATAMQLPPIGHGYHNRLWFFRADRNRLAAAAGRWRLHLSVCYNGTPA
jgi:hypothetical protein